MGTSGYSYKEWRGKFYPQGVAQKSWLTFYAQHYNAVEVNATFYRPFPQSVYARWAEITSPEFRFVLKAPKVITHDKALEAVEDDLQSFAVGSRTLGEKLAAVLWQFPAGSKVHDLQERFTKFLPALPKDMRHVFEFRHKSWFTDEVYALLNQYDAGFVINDSPQFPKQEVITDHLMYLRLHGPGKLYNSRYTSEQLRAWAEKIKSRLAEMDVFVFFNNTMSRDALDNANELRDLLKG